MNNIELPGKLNLFIEEISCTKYPNFFHLKNLEIQSKINNLFTYYQISNCCYISMSSISKDISFFPLKIKIRISLIIINYKIY